MDKNIAFRVDADAKIGLGHLKRCINLAKNLKNKNKNIIFLVHKNNDNFHLILKKNKFKFFLLKKKADISETVSVIKKRKIDTLIVDHYEINIKWEKSIKTFLNNLIVIDDLNRKHNCDYLFLQSFGKTKIDHKKNIYMGNKYFIIDEKYNQNLKIQKNNKKYYKILINFGTNDIKNLTCKLLNHIKLNYSKYKIDIIIDKRFKFLKELRKLANNKIKIYKNIPSLYKVTSNNDFFFGAGGIHNIERTTLGKISYVIKTAKNQEKNINYLKKNGLIFYLGTKDKYNFNLINLKKFNYNFIKSHSQRIKKKLKLNGISSISKIINQIK